MMNECFSKNDDSPTALVATICDPRFKLAIFERLWKDNPSCIKCAKIHFSDIENTKIEPRDNAISRPSIKKPKTILNSTTYTIYSQVTMAALILQLRTVITGFLKAPAVLERLGNITRDRG